LDNFNRKRVQLHISCRFGTALEVMLTISSYLAPTKEEVNVFARVCLSVCLSVCQSISKINQKRVHGFG